MTRELTRVYLLSTPLDANYEHTLYFDNAAKQSAYLSSCVQHYFDDFSYQRKDNLIKVPKHYDDIQNCNYVMYQNARTSKWYYAFIKEMQYISDGMTHITIETDVIQTWMFDYEIKQSFVEREHVAVDNAGEHTYPENVELGEMVVNDHTEFMNYDTATELVYVMASTYNPKTGQDVKGGRLYGGIYSGVGYFRYTKVSEINDAIDQIVSDGKADAITGLFMLPQSIVQSSNVGLIDADVLPAQIPASVTKPYKLNGYAPVNKKLLCYPFSYLLVTNGSGTTAIYRYEDFSDTTCNFTIYGTITPGGSVRLVPNKYKGANVNVDEGISGGKFPICNYNVDMYTNWLTQNSVNEHVGYEAKETISYIQNGLSAIGSLFTLNFGGVSSAAAGIMDTMSQKYQASLIPDQAKGNLNSGDVSTSMGRNCFQVYQMSIKQEYAKQIDGFLNMYGYQVNQLKVPNKNHRSTWWYTKCLNVNIDSGVIPHNDLDIIRRCYNNGITFWKSPLQFKDYSVPNGTITS